MKHPVVHWELGVRDAQMAREFYAQAFGWELADAGPDYTLVPPVEGGLGGGIMQISPEMPPYVTIYVQVDDLAAKLAEITRLGGTTLVEPTEISTTASFALFTDPSGNVVGLLKQNGPVTG